MTSETPRTSLVVGVDVGGTKTDAVVLDSAGSVLQRVRTPTGFGPEAVIQTTTRAVSGLADALGITPSGFSSIGVGIPGRVDVASGVVAHAVNLGLEGLELGAILRDRLGVAVRVENDVNAAAMGAFQLLGLERSNSLAYLNLGTGLAAGMILRGELWRGFGGSAGEIGHIPMDPTGPVCACGQRGCLEMLASGSAVARMWPTSHKRPIQDLFDAALEQRSNAVAVKTTVVENIAAAVRLLILTTDVERVVLGGGLTSVGQPLIDAVRRVLAGWARESSFLGSLGLEARVWLLQASLPAALGTNVPVAALGAAHLGASTA